MTISERLSNAVMILLDVDFFIADHWQNGMSFSEVKECLSMLRNARDLVRAARNIYKLHIERELPEDVKSL